MVAIGQEPRISTGGQSEGLQSFHTLTSTQPSGNVTPKTSEDTLMTIDNLETANLGKTTENINNWMDYTVLGDPSEYEEMLREMQEAEGRAGVECEEGGVGEDPAVMMLPTHVPEEIAAEMEKLPEEGAAALLQAYQARMALRSEMQSQASILQGAEQARKAYERLNVQPSGSDHTGGSVERWGREGRHDRALGRWDEYEQQWNSIETKLALTTGTKPEKLVMERMDEHRRKIETQHNINMAVPPEDRMAGGDNMWRMSLRDNWTKYVPIGHLFSGLFCPVYEKGANPKDTMMVRRRKALEVSAEELKSMKATFKGFRKKMSTKAWTESPYLIQRQKDYARALNEMCPHDVEEGFGVVGKSYRAQFEEAMYEPVSLAELEAYLQAHNKDAWEAIELARSIAKQRAQQEIEARLAAEAAEEAKKIKGPRLQLDTSHLMLPQCNAGGTSRTSLTVTNIGTTVLYYKWNRQDLDMMPGATPGGQKCFYLHDQGGVLLPGDTKSFLFSFQSSKPGIFRDCWQLSTSPEVPQEHRPGPVTLKGVSLSQDTTKLQRAQLVHKLDLRQAEHKVEHSMARLVVNACSNAPKPKQIPMLTGSPDASIFSYMNANFQPSVYYSPTVHDMFTKLYNEMQAVHKARESPTPTGDARPATPSKGGKGGKDAKADKKDAKKDAKGGKGGKGAGKEEVKEEEEEVKVERPKGWDGALDTICDYVAKVQECKDAQGRYGMQYEEVYDLGRRLEFAVEEAMLPASRLTVLQHEMHDILGNIADQVADHVDHSVTIATFMIKERKKEEAEEEAKKQAERDAKIQQYQDQGLEPPEELVNPPELQPELDENGVPIPPPPEPPVESLQTPEFMEVFTEKITEVACNELNTFQKRVKEQARVVASELDRRIAIAQKQKYHWTAFDLLRYRDALLVGDMRVPLNYKQEDEMLGMDLWRHLHNQRIEQLGLKAQLERMKNEEEEEMGAEGQPPPEELTPEDLLEKHKSKLSKANDLLGDLKANALAELKSYPRAPRCTARVLQAILMILGHKPKEVEEWGKMRTMIDQGLVLKMRGYDAAGKRNAKTWKAINVALKNLTDPDVAKESAASLVLFRWSQAAKAVSDAAAASRKKPPPEVDPDNPDAEPAEEDMDDEFMSDKEE